MTFRRIALSITGLYQFVRITLLLGVLIGLQALAGDAVPPGLLITAAAGGLLPVLLIVQLGLTRAAALLAPLRTALFLQLVGSLVLAAGYRGIALPPGTPELLALAAASLLVVADTASLVFLLSWKAPVARRSEQSDSEQPAGFTVEELED